LSAVPAALSIPCRWTWAEIRNRSSENSSQPTIAAPM
jgi:hypothetical protein